MEYAVPILIVIAIAIYVFIEHNKAKKTAQPAQPVKSDPVLSPASLPVLADPPAKQPSLQPVIQAAPPVVQAAPVATPATLTTPSKVVFDYTQYPDPAERLQALHDLMAKSPVGTKIYGPDGHEVDVRGNSTAPVGTAPDRSKSSFDFPLTGEWLIFSETSKTYSVPLPGPGHFEIHFGETPALGTSAPDQLRVTVSGQPAQMFSDAKNASVSTDVSGPTSFLLEALDLKGAPQSGRELGITVQFQQGVDPLKR